MSREISIWIDDRWYDALSKHLKDETLEEHLENVVDEMCKGHPLREVLTMTNRKTPKRRKLRNSEYYDMQKVFDGLYADSKTGKAFTKLMPIITSEENIRLAFQSYVWHSKYTMLPLTVTAPL